MLLQLTELKQRVLMGTVRLCACAYAVTPAPMKALSSIARSIARFSRSCVDARESAPATCARGLDNVTRGGSRLWR